MKVLFLNEAPLIRLGLAEGFKQLGHIVHVIAGEEERLWGKEVPEQIILINKAMDDFEPDLVFLEGNFGISIKDVLPEIRKRKVPIFYWAIEDPIADFLVDAHIPYVDYIFTTAEEKIPRYLSKGKPSSLLLFACNPEIHKNVGVLENYKHDIVLVASNYSNRYTEAEWFVMPLIEAGYDIKIWGLWWNDYRRPVSLEKYPEIYGGVLPYEELAKVYSSAKIVLGMNADDTSETQTSMRPYEVLGCGGGAYLGHYTKATENIFGNMLWQAKNERQVIDTIDYLLSHDEERDKVVRDAQRFVYERHTYKQRAERIVKVYDNFIKG